MTAAVAVVAIVLQLVLVIIGDPVLTETKVPEPGIRLGRFVSHFTIQSNQTVAVTTLARHPDRDGAVRRVIRLAGVVGMTVTGLVHWFLLRPLLDLDLHSAGRVALTGSGVTVSSSPCWLRRTGSTRSSPRRHAPDYPSLSRTASIPRRTSSKLVDSGERPIRRPCGSR